MHTLWCHFLFCGEQNFPRRETVVSEPPNPCTFTRYHHLLIISVGSAKLRESVCMWVCVGFPWSCMFRLQSLNWFVRVRFHPEIEHLQNTIQKGKTIYVSSPAQVLWEFGDGKQTQVTLRWAVLTVRTGFQELKWNSFEMSECLRPENICSRRSWRHAVYPRPSPGIAATRLYFLRSLYIVSILIF